MTAIENGLAPAPRVDLSGRRFGRLVAVRYTGQSRWECRCDCGRSVRVWTNSLTAGNSQSCGCLARAQASRRLTRDESGNSYGWLTVVRRVGSDKAGKAVWECRCRCGRLLEVTGDALRQGRRSCGCERGAVTAERRARKFRGKRFGRLVAVREVAPASHLEDARWECSCDCGKTAVVRLNGLRSGTTRSCGCLNDETRRRIHADLTGTRFGKLVIVRREGTCPTGATWLARCDCGTEKVLSTSQLRRRTKPTRSCGCSVAELLRQNTRERNRRWKPDLSDEERRARRDYAPGYAWINAVLARDEYRCVLCKSGRRLHAHHLDGWHWATDLRFDVANGVTLCHECHTEFHRLYGNERNTKAQFEEFRVDASREPLPHVPHGSPRSTTRARWGLSNVIVEVITGATTPLRKYQILRELKRRGVVVDPYLTRTIVAYLSRLSRAGRISRVGKGVYAAAGAETT